VPEDLEEVNARIWLIMVAANVAVPIAAMVLDLKQARSESP